MRQAPRIAGRKNQASVPARRRSQRRVASTPWTKNASSSASPSVPLSASTATLSTPCTGRAVRGSMMCEYVTPSLSNDFS